MEPMVLPNNCQPADYIRLDGSGISSFTASVGGLVNEQVYSVGATTQGYEAFRIVKQ